MWKVSLVFKNFLQVFIASKAEYLRIIEDFEKQGAQAVILGCTEIGLLVKQEDTHVKLLDTTFIHVDKAIDFALGRV